MTDLEYLKTKRFVDEVIASMLPKFPAPSTENREGRRVKVRRIARAEEIG